MAKTYTYSADMYTWTQEAGKQHAYTLTGEVQACNHNAAQCQAYYDVLVQRVETEANQHTHIGKIDVKEA